jgi:arylsulfatase A-like enzyme
MELSKMMRPGVFLLLLAATSAFATPPNILLIVADDVGAEASSLHRLAGKLGPAPMPNLERIAAGGLVFDNVWVNPMCSPTRATILTGRYGHRTGVLIAGDVLDPGTTTIWDQLRDKSPARYDMAVFGKYHLGGNGGAIKHVQDLRVPNFRGFLGAQVADYFKWTAWSSDGSSREVTAYATTAITDWAIEFLDRHQATRPQDPWFLYLPYNAAHGPFQAPPANLHSQDLGSLQPGERQASVPVYRAMIEALDTELGRLLAHIDLTNTIVIYLGDNGTPANVKDEDSKVRNSKTSVYEGGARVSLVIAGAGVTRRGREAALVNGVDLYATIASLAGIDLTQANDGYSLTPLLTTAGADTGRRFSLTEFCSPRAQRFALRDPRYKLLFDHQDGWGLFDLEQDIGETNNLHGQVAYAAPQAKLQAELDRYKAEPNKGCFQ